jgi:hypothetical protein
LRLNLGCLGLEDRLGLDVLHVLLVLDDFLGSLGLLDNWLGLGVLLVLDDFLGGLSLLDDWLGLGVLLVLDDFLGGLSLLDDWLGLGVFLVLDHFLGGLSLLDDWLGLGVLLVLDHFLGGLSLLDNWLGLGVLLMRLFAGGFGGRLGLHMLGVHGCFVCAGSGRNNLDGSRLGGCRLRGSRCHAGGRAETKQGGEGQGSQFIHNISPR